jgi:SAM-dependent methyltransferase
MKNDSYAQFIREAKMPDYQQAYGKLFVAVHQRKEVADMYDKCRYISPKVVNSLTESILAFNPNSVLEAGVGNGRLFVPLVKKARKRNKDLSFYGVDASYFMLQKLEDRTKNQEDIHLFNYDLRDNNFQKKMPKIDLIYTFATMHIISDGWQTALDNLLNTLSEKGALILGEEINAVFHGSEKLFADEDYRLDEIGKSIKCEQDDIDRINSFFRKYHQLRERHGFPFCRKNGQILHGDQSPAERYIRSKGFCQKTIQKKELMWLKTHSFSEILYCIENGTVTTLGSDLPQHIRKSICTKLERFCESNHYDIEKIMHIPSEIQLQVFKRLK